MSSRKGFVYDTTSRADPGDVSPEASDYVNVEDVGVLENGTFQANITGLTSDTTYYYRAFGSDGAEPELHNVLSEPQPAGDVNGDWQTSSMSADSQTIISGTSSRLYLSTDKGTNWSETQPAGNNNQNWTASAMSSDGQTIIVGVNGGRLYLSTNGGTTWSETQPAGNNNQNWIASAISSDGQTIVAAAYNGRMYLSTNKGSTWSVIYPFGSSTSNFRWITASISGDGTTIIAGTDDMDAGLFLSTDGGINWTWLAGSQGQSPFPTWDENWVTSSISEDGQVIIVANDNTWSGGELYLSTNGGTTWSTPRPAGSSYKNWNTVSVSGDGLTLLAGIKGERLYLSTNEGNTWDELQPDGNNDRNWQTTSMNADGQTILAGVQGGRLYLYYSEYKYLYGDEVSFTTLGSIDGGQYLTNGYRLSGAVFYGDSYCRWIGSISNVRSCSFFIKDYANSQSVIKLNSTANITIDSSGDITTTGLSGVAIVETPVNGWTHVQINFNALTVTDLEVGRVDSNYYIGELDEFTLFSKTLNFEERQAIQANMFDNNHPLYTDCVLWWSFDNPVLADNRAAEADIVLVEHKNNVADILFTFETSLVEPYAYSFTDDDESDVEIVEDEE